MNHNFKNFQILVLRNGKQIIQSLVTPMKYNLLGIIISTFPSISELDWLKSEILKGFNSQERFTTGLNNFSCVVDKNNCELSNLLDSNKIQIIPIELVLEYIEECILFLNEFNSCKIDGIIPNSKKKDLVIIPKEFVNEKYFDDEKTNFQFPD